MAALELDHHLPPPETADNNHASKRLHPKICDRTTLDQGIQTRSLFRTELHDILLYSDLSRGHESAPSLRHGAINSDILPNVNDVAD